jgi:hypothetical protein
MFFPNMENPSVRNNAVMIFPLGLVLVVINKIKKSKHDTAELSNVAPNPAMAI